MSSPDFERAHAYLQNFVGKTLASFDCDESHLRLVFEGGTNIETHGPWRIVSHDILEVGSGDVGSPFSKDALELLIGRQLVHASITLTFVTGLGFEGDQTVELISDSVQYEVWEAHLKEAWVIFQEGQLTVFPPASSDAKKERVS
jgi:hypothetical protein